MDAAVLGPQNQAGTAVRVGMGPAAGRPADLRVDEADRRQRAGHARFLAEPMGAVVGVPDRAAVAHGPAVLRIDEADVAEPGVAAERVVCGGLATDRHGRQRLRTANGSVWPNGRAARSRKATQLTMVDSSRRARF